MPSLTGGLCIASSEVERDGCNAEILLLLELVLQCREEFRVDFASELFDIVYRLFKVLLLVASPFFHFRVPGIDFLDCLGT